MRIGVVSDTHGLFDPRLERLFEGVSLILHGGDICGSEVIRRLEAIAPVRAIRGNCDDGYDTKTFPEWRVEDFSGLRVLIVHDLGPPARPKPEAAALIQRSQPKIVISGHSHLGKISSIGGRLFLNPGSAGRKRFKFVRSAALLSLEGTQLSTELRSVETPEFPILARCITSLDLAPAVHRPQV